MTTDGPVPDGMARCFQCWELRSEEAGHAISAGWICDHCADANVRRYSEAYGDEPLAAWQAEGR